ITRIGVRYINKIDIPLPAVDLKQYLRTAPDISPDMRQGIAGFFMQLQIPQEDLKAMLYVNEALIPPPNPNVISVILDLDLFRGEDLPTNDEDLWQIFEQFRDRKNQLFEAYITDRTRRLIE